MQISFSKLTIGQWFKLVCWVILSVSSFYISPLLELSPGLDPSWIYSINLPHQWGRSFVFTYGPLGFLLSAVNVNGHLEMALAFWILLFVISSLLYWRLLKRINLDTLLDYVVLGAFTFLVMLFYATPERFMCILPVISIFMAYKIDRRYFVAACAFLILGLLMKISLGMQILSAIILFDIICFIFKDDNRCYYLIFTITAIVSFFIVLFLTCCQSVNGVLQYLRGAFEITAGYNAAMSSIIDSGKFHCIGVLLISLLLIFCVIKSARSKEALVFLITITGPLFVEYKHAFVRMEIIRIEDAMPFAGVLLALVFLFITIYVKNMPRECLYVLPAALLICATFSNTSLYDCLHFHYQNTVKVPGMIQKIKSQNLAEVSLPLPDDLLKRIDGASVCIYPWEVSYCLSHNFEYNQFPVVQAYSAYTPYLDKLDADFFCKDDSPEYIILELCTIDDRWPLIECPQTWRAIKENYFLDSDYDDIFLLKKKGPGEVGKETLYSSRAFEMEKDDWIRIENDKVYKIKAELSFCGKIIGLLWQVPAITLKVETEGGDILEHRIIMENLKGGVLFDYAIEPYSSEDFLQYMKGDACDSKVRSISFGGMVLKLFTRKVFLEECQSSYM